MIVVVDDKLDCYEYMKQISSVIKQVLIDFDIIINAYPIRECVYQKGMSEFLDNVRKNAIIIWEN
jgi:hypothetical protein